LLPNGSQFNLGLVFGLKHAQGRARISKQNIERTDRKGKSRDSDRLKVAWTHSIPFRPMTIVYLIRPSLHGEVPKSRRAPHRLSRQEWNSLPPAPVDTNSGSMHTGNYSMAGNFSDLVSWYSLQCRLRFGDASTTYSDVHYHISAKAVRQFKKNPKQFTAIHVSLL